MDLTKLKFIQAMMGVWASSLAKLREINKD